jgi:3-deoxy-D-manno-octulosonate 8-phosphate phosphatase (KDO 8-P phosphatase)
MERRDVTLMQRLFSIQLMMFDVDGVLTDGTLYYNERGEALKAFNVLDGLGIRMLVDADIRTAIVSGRNSDMVRARARDLGIEIVMQGVTDKSAALDQIVREHDIPARNIGYMGDDVIDIGLMRRVGFAATVPNAATGVAAHAHWMSNRPGGQGAVREVCELILGAQGKLDGLLAAYGAA